MSRPIIVCKPGTTTTAERKQLRDAGYCVIQADEGDIAVLQPTPIAAPWMADALLRSVRKLPEYDADKVLHRVGKALIAKTMEEINPVGDDEVPA